GRVLAQRLLAKPAEAVLTFDAGQRQEVVNDEPIDPLGVFPLAFLLQAGLPLLLFGGRGRSLLLFGCRTLCRLIGPCLLRPRPPPTARPSRPVPPATQPGPGPPRARAPCAGAQVSATGSRRSADGPRRPRQPGNAGRRVPGRWPTRSGGHAASPGTSSPPSPA